MKTQAKFHSGNVTGQDIKEGNKLIAEFDQIHRYGALFPIESFLNRGKYHRSFDWLMPVLRQIERQGCIVEVWMSLASGCKILSLNPNGNWQTVNESDSTIEAVYNSVLDYIKWYNSNKSAR